MYGLRLVALVPQVLRTVRLLGGLLCVVIMVVL